MNLTVHHGLFRLEAERSAMAVFGVLSVQRWRLRVV